MKISNLAVSSLLLLVAGAGFSAAFAPVGTARISRPALETAGRPSVLCLSSSTKDDGEKGISMPSLPKLDTAIVDDVTTSLTKIDQINIGNIQQNVMDGPFGSRGEIYFAIQAVLVLSIVLGGIPAIQPVVTILLGPGLLVAGLAIAVASVVDMGGALTPFTKPPTTAQAKLVTDGLYKYMRHPMYTGLISLMVGLSILSGSADRLLLAGLLFVFLDFKSSKEEEEMLVLYGNEYEAYMKQVPTKFFPQNVITQD